jgi:urease accessory protein
MRGGVTMTASETFAANRASGAVACVVHVRDGVTRRGELSESGSLRVRFPSPETQGLAAVFVNTAGGVAGGDRFDVSIEVRAAARLTVTTAAAEKIYRSHGPEARLSIALRVQDDAHLAWLPQETILFDQARVARQIEIDLAESASLLMCEMVVFGRSAMGERMAQGQFLDNWRLRRGGRLVFAENIRLEGDIATKLARPAIARSGVAVATVLIAPADEAFAARVRDAAVAFGGEVGVSAWNGFAMVRFCAQDAARLRADVIAVLARLAPSALPRIWLQ